MLKTKKNLMLLTLLFIPVLGFSQENKNKLKENKEISSMIAIREEGATFFGIPKISFMKQVKMQQ